MNENDFEIEEEPNEEAMAENARSETEIAALNIEHGYAEVPIDIAYFDTSEDVFTVW